MFPFENLEVYRKAFLTSRQVYDLLRKDRVIAPYAKNQLGKATLSIMLNIAEGSAKLSRKDRRNFYIIVRGSTFESAALVSFLFDEGEISIEYKERLCFAYEEISKMLYKLIKNLSTE